MTLTEEGVQALEEETAEESKRGRDFTKTRQYHTDLANFINERSGLDAVTPNQIKAVLALRTDYGNTEEAKAARQQRKAAAAAEASKYAGMSDDQKKAAKAANRANAQAQRLQEKANEALARAQQLSQQASGSGEDLQAIVDSSQNNAESVSEEEAEPKRRVLGRRR